MTFKELRLSYGMNLTQISESFEIPYRTLQHWEHETRKCPEYLLKLMEYKLKGMTDMMDFWKCSNMERAEQNTLNSVIGYLKAKHELEKDITPEEVLQFIENKVKEETERLNEKYPEMK